MGNSIICQKKQGEMGDGIDSEEGTSWIVMNSSDVGGGEAVLRIL
jgi:hypothetical protein